MAHIDVVRSRNAWKRPKGRNESDACPAHGGLLLGIENHLLIAVDGQGQGGPLVGHFRLVEFLLVEPNQVTLGPRVELVNQALAQEQQGLVDAVGRLGSEGLDLNGANG